MDAITLLESDHREVEGLFSRFETASARDRRGIADTIVKELSIHSEIEKLHLYPTVRDEVPDGAALADHSLAEHRIVDELLAKAYKYLDEAGSTSFGDLMLRIKSEVQAHVQEEETEIFPKLRASVSTSRLDELGDQLAAAKKTAPTRPHPAAPDQGPAHQVMGRAAGMVDRARDTITGR